ncbi:MAG: hypothetical protein J3K34DRAFT_448108 [Monoraphidium minutum]|nr:MAG: hypothetical protein J3K34DRAFT_448108 [Monoraphidium minutum]
MPSAPLLLGSGAACVPGAAAGALGGSCAVRPSDCRCASRPRSMRCRCSCVNCSRSCALVLWGSASAVAARRCGVVACCACCCPACHANGPRAMRSRSSCLSCSNSSALLLMRAPFCSTACCCCC